MPHIANNTPDGSSPHEPELNPAFEVLEPAELLSPLVFSSPHSGNIYPKTFLDSSRLDAMALRRSEDAYVDELFAPSIQIGAPLLRAKFPRAFLDLNREPYELDPRMFEGRLPGYANTRSLRVAGGLGTIARVVGESQEIYKSRMPVEAALQRIEQLYRPYHAALKALLQRAKLHFGQAVLVDCHSMPSSSANGSILTNKGDTSRVDFVLGDRFGTSASAVLVDAAESELKRLGYIVRRNKPYAGGFITEHYGNPASGCHALQIEINRALYMDEKKLEKLERFDAIAADLMQVSQAITHAAWLDRRALPLAAE